MRGGWSPNGGQTPSLVDWGQGRTSRLRSVIERSCNMTHSFLVKTAVAFGGLAAAASLSSAVGIASAQPLDGPLIHTKCSYDQIVAALRVEAPDAAAKLEQKPEKQAKMREFFALPVDQRQQRMQQKLDENPERQAKMEAKRNTPEGQAKIATMNRVAETCGNY